MMPERYDVEITIKGKNTAMRVTIGKRGVEREAQDRESVTQD